MIFMGGGWIGDGGFGGGAFRGEERRCEGRGEERRGEKWFDLSFGSTPISPLRYEHQLEYVIYTSTKSIRDDLLFPVATFSLLASS
jgi:hypothetical protein